MATLPIINEPNESIQIDDADVPLLQGRAVHSNCDKRRPNYYVYIGKQPMYIRRILLGNPNQQTTCRNGDNKDLRRSNLALMKKSLPKFRSFTRPKTPHSHRPYFELLPNEITAAINEAQHENVDSRIVVDEQLKYAPPDDAETKFEKIATARKLINLAMEILNDVEAR